MLIPTVLINVAKCKSVWVENSENPEYELKCIAIPHDNQEQNVISSVEHCVKMKYKCQRRMLVLLTNGELLHSLGLEHCVQFFTVSEERISLCLWQSSKGQFP